MFLKTLHVLTDRVKELTTYYNEPRKLSPISASVNSITQVLVTLKGLNQDNWTLFSLFLKMFHLPSRWLCQF